MKKIWITLAIALCTTLIMSSCTSKDELMKLKGEWTITEANGQPINLENAFIGFDIEAGRLYGNSGCNNISATLEAENLPNELEIDDFISTLALCDDSDIELNIQNAISRIEKFKVSKDGQTATMYAENKVVVLVLEKRNSDSTLSDDTVASVNMTSNDLTVITPDELNGEWKVLQISEININDEQLETQPLIAFDIANLTVAGHLSCNSFSSSIEFDDQDDDDYDASSIDIEAIMTTRMACKNMKVEQALTKALSDADHFYMNADGTVSLYANDEQVVIIKRM